MKPEAISQAKEDMEGILGHLDVVRHLDGGGYLLMSKDHPSLIGRGDLALVLALTRQMVAKIVFFDETDEHKGQYALEGLYVGEVPNSIEKTVSALREMGFDNILDHVEINRYPDGKPDGGYICPYFYHVSPDLREEGKYTVFSIDEFPFDHVENGGVLAIQVEESLQKIKANIDSGEYALEVDHHGTSDSPDEALRKMFIGRVNNETNQGQLFFADLDHCVIRKISPLS